MKTMRKMATILLVLVMVLAMTVPVFAAGNGTITVTDATEGQVYTVYKILDLESYNDTGAYSYTVAAGWAEFVSGSDYLKEENGYVVWVAGDDADVAAFAKAALAFAKENSIPGTAKKAEGTTVTFENLDLGYYLVDTSMGTLCALNTTDPSAEVKEKNTAPTLDKKLQIQEGVYDVSNSVNVGDTVKFRITVTAGSGAQNYIIHDVMDPSFDLDKESIQVSMGSTTVAASAYEIKTENLSDGCTFHIEFTEDFCNALTVGNEIVVTYEAKLNAAAKYENFNKAWLTYDNPDDKGDPDDPDPDPDTNETPDRETVTYNFNLAIFKWSAGEGEGNKIPLEGAKFVLKNATDATAKYYHVDDTGVVTWVDKENATVVTSDAEGNLAFKGLAAGTYYLEETEAPKGYNKLAGAVEILISSEKADTTEGDDGAQVVTGVVSKDVENKSGTELPSTGGIGTTIFYVLGGVMVAAAVVLLITKRRMAA